MMIDHGQCFNGVSWQMRDSQGARPFIGGDVYSGVTGLATLWPWIQLVTALTPWDFEDLCTSIPPEWLGNDHANLATLLDQLFDRVKLLPQLLNESCAAHPAQFPNWRNT